ncbi:hypothetical protein DERP_001881, partial [Dermatophagoides pteronyssinus]
PTESIQNVDKFIIIPSKERKIESTLQQEKKLQQHQGNIMVDKIYDQKKCSMFTIIRFKILARPKNKKQVTHIRYIYWIPKFTDHNYDNVWNILETKENVNRNY